MTTPEELGCLAGGPARAAEVALAGLLDSGLVRVSRDGVVTAVHQPGRGPSTLLEAQILAGLRTGRRPLDDVLTGAARSAEAEALRTQLVGRGLLRRRRSWRPRLYPWLYLLAAGLVVAGLVAVFIPGLIDILRIAVPQWPLLPSWVYFACGALVIVWAVVLTARDPGRLRTREAFLLVKQAERQVVRNRRTAYTDPHYRLAAVAVLGLAAEAALFGLDPAVVPGRDSTSSSSCGSGCSSGGGCSSGCGGGCGD